MLNLDTHVLVHALGGRLTPGEDAILRSDTWSIADIVLWEIAKLIELGRVETNLDDPALIRALSRIHVWPITLEICKALGDLDFRGDPADQLIAATSVVHRLPLVTRDRVIRKSRVVPIAR